VSFLLDTHVWIWTQEQPDTLGSTARALLETTTEELCVSAVSSLEIARLVAGGLVELKGSLDRWVRSAIDSLEARSLDVDHQIALEAYKLPGRFHKDPTDRMLVATARLRDLTLVTADERILAYCSVRTLDVRN
jgi:PIN domain nuclease of toxin-antitoxin system